MPVDCALHGALSVTYSCVCCRNLREQTTLSSRFSKMDSRMLAPRENFMSCDCVHCKHKERQGSFVLIVLISYISWINNLHNVVQKWLQVTYMDEGEVTGKTKLVLRLTPEPLCKNPDMENGVRAHAYVCAVVTFGIYEHFTVATNIGAGYNYKYSDEWLGRLNVAICKITTKGGGMNEVISLKE